MKTNQINPYERLLRTFREYADLVDYPKIKHMWTYPKEKLGEHWSLNDLAQRVIAADQLGFDTVLTVVEGSLQVRYVAKRPSRPCQIL